MKSKGMTINCSMIQNDGEYELGFKYEDTNGVEFDGTYNSDDPEEMLNDLFNDVLEEIIANQLPEETKEEEKETDSHEYVKELEKIINDLTAENKSLKTDVDILQKRMDNIVNNSMKEKEKKPKKVKSNIKGRIYPIDPIDNLWKIWF